MSKRHRIGVLGAGHLGRIHIQQLKEIEDWEVVGFHDPHPEKCEAITAEFGVEATQDPEALIDRVDVVDIVTPTLSHFDLASKALRAGKHVFIEKPLTNTVAEADELLALSRSCRRSVQVGHVERFNPAFQAALPFFASPMFIETHRLAQFNPRGTDVSVVLDLMIHDIDIVLHVVKCPVADIRASGVAVVSDTPDIANARIAFANGCVANLTASRISMKNMRKSRFFQRDAYIAVDMLTKSTEIVRMRTVEGEPDPFAVTMDLGPDKGIREISFEKPEVHVTNAIREELRAFATSIRKGEPPAVSIEDGAEALRTAHRILGEMTMQNA
ncbi:MAG: Gfo/Idh/MocA family oxidoreductase [Flavobacteriales bacterium]|nr:Gfo/Idh/MocA family oxidoreductase [Flavobacteriales bacterium]